MNKKNIITLLSILAMLSILACGTSSPQGSEPAAPAPQPVTDQAAEPADPTVNQTPAQQQPAQANATAPSPISDPAPTAVPAPQKTTGQNAQAANQSTGPGQQTPNAEPTAEPPPAPKEFWGTEETDREVLLELYNSTGGDNWVNNENWLSNKPIGEWYGVKAEQKRVSELDLASNGLTGTLPDRIWLMNDVETLYLEGNSITGEIPVLDTLQKAEGNFYLRLTTIDLSDNQLAGCVPVFLTDIIGTNYGEYSPLERCPNPEREALEALYNATEGSEWTNQENWMTDAPIAKWQGVKTSQEGKVIELTLTHNNLNGPITAVARLQHLESLALGNSIQSDLSKAREEGKDSLTFITEKKGNRIDLPLPEELFEMSNLKHLALNAIALNGQFPSGFTRMESLEVLSLYYNDLEAPIPPEVQNFKALTFLDLSGNLLTGQIPLELAQIKTLENLNLSKNRLNGTIPVEITNFPRLKTLNLRRNALEGGIPPQLGTMEHLRYLDLERNELSGTIPEELGNLPALTGNPKDDEQGGVINLQYNNLTGEIPPSLGNLTPIRLLLLGGNQLTGNIPRQLGNLQNLTFLDLGHNMLTGNLPRQLAEIQTLELISVRDNQLTGKIPQEFAERDDLALDAVNNNFDE